LSVVHGLANIVKNPSAELRRWIGVKVGFGYAQRAAEYHPEGMPPAALQGWLVNGKFSLNANSVWQFHARFLSLTIRFI
jgi:hypothetical protein